MAHSELPVAQLKAELFKALAHPARIRALEQLGAGERSVSDLAAAIGVDVSFASQQLAILRRAGIVATRREGTTIYYSLRDERIAELLRVAREMLVSSLQDSRAILDSLERPTTSGAR
jgi:DNA-binding transcriptional ArsR family regulator